MSQQYQKRGKNSYQKPNYRKNRNNSNSPSKNDSKKWKDEKKDNVNSESMNTSSYVGSENDPKWYNRDARLIQDASKISFSNQLGRTLDYTSQPVDGLGISFTDESLPGIMALQMINCPGIAKTATDGMNIATAGVFQYIRKNLSTVATYAPADVMAAILAIDEIYSMYANITRVFGIINAYSAINLYIPIKLLEAGYGFTAAEVANIRANLNDLRAKFNNFIFKASTLYLPTTFTVTARHAWLYSNYFTDANSSKAQIYIHRMMYNHIWDEVTYPTGSALVTEENELTLEGLIDHFGIMIDQVRNSDSFLRIQADMKRAFETANTWSLAYVDEAYLIYPTYSEEVMTQIHNTTILIPPLPEPVVGGVWNISDFDVTQDVNHNTLIFSPDFTMVTADLPSLPADVKGILGYQTNRNRILNFYKQEVSSDDICEATRNTVALSTLAVAANTTFSIAACGVDLCIGVEILNDEDTDTIDQVLDVVSTEAKVKLACKYANFDWAPIVLLQTAELPDFHNNYQINTDLENYTVVDNATLNRLHENILCSMWSIPELGGFNA